MTLRTGVIAVTNPGHVAAEGFVENALANNPSCAGFVIYDDGKLNISRITNPDLATLNKVFSGCKDFQVNVHLGNYPPGFLPEDIQPFVLVEDENKNPVVAVMLDGDWVNSGPTGSSHSDEFFVALNQLRPMFQQLYKLTKGDIGAMIEEVDGDATKNSILNTFIGRGSVHLMFNNGKVRTILKNELEKEYKWGWVSNPFMYTEDQKPAEKPGLLSSLLGDKAMPKMAPTLTAEPRAEPAEVKPPLPEVKPAPAVALPGTEGPRKVSAPRELKKPYKIESWYKNNANWVPPNYAEYPEVEVRPKVAKGPVAAAPSAIKDLKDLPKVVTSTAVPKVLPDVTSTPADIEKRTPPPLPGPKRVAPVEPIKQPDKPAAVVPPTPVVKKDTVPAMTPESQKKIVDHWLKETETMVTTVDRSGNPIISPKEAVALETKYADFAERLGIKFEDIFSWRVDRLEKLLYEYPDAALHLMCDLRQKFAAAQSKSAATGADTKKGTIIMPKLSRTG